MKDKDPFFSASISPEELEKILQSIDENLAAKPDLRKGSSQAQEIATVARYILPVPAPLPDLSTSIEIIRNAKAPYYVVDGSLPARLVKKILNLFLKFFGRKQAYYNTLTLDVLDSLSTSTTRLHNQSTSQVIMINELLNTVVQLERSLEELHTAQADGQKKAKPTVLKNKSGSERKKTSLLKR